MLKVFQVVKACRLTYKTFELSMWLGKCIIYEQMENTIGIRKQNIVLELKIDSEFLYFMYTKKWTTG